MNRKALFLGTVIVISCLLFIMLAVYATGGKPAGPDITILACLAQHRTGTADAVFRYLTWAGSFYVLAPLCLLISYVLGRGGRPARAWFFLSSFMGAALAARVLKNLLGSERPDLYPPLVDTFTAYAFPSAHAAQVSAFCLALYLLLKLAHQAWCMTAGLMMLILVVTVLFSRLYLQVHYPGDVIAGAVLGTICVVASFALFRKRLK